MNTTVKKYSYYLRHDCDVDAIGFEAQEHGCEFLTGTGQLVINIWENNPYNILFALKYSEDVRAIKNENWYI